MIESTLWLLCPNSVEDWSLCRVQVTNLFTSAAVNQELLAKVALQRSDSIRSCSVKSLWLNSLEGTSGVDLSNIIAPNDS